MLIVPTQSLPKESIGSGCGGSCTRKIVYLTWFERFIAVSTYRFFWVSELLSIRMTGVSWKPEGVQKLEIEQILFFLEIKANWDKKKEPILFLTINQWVRWKSFVTFWMILFFPWKRKAFERRINRFNLQK